METARYAPAEYLRLMASRRRPDRVVTVSATCRHLLERKQGNGSAPIDTKDPLAIRVAVRGNGASMQLVLSSI